MIKRKSFLLGLLIIGVVYFFLLLAIAAAYPRLWTWGKGAVIIVAGCIWYGLYIRYRKCDPYKFMPRYVDEEDFFRMADVVLSMLLLFLIAFLPRPWTYGNIAVFFVLAIAWLLVLRKDASWIATIFYKIRRIFKRKPPSCLSPRQPAYKLPVK